jgi:hypothetical protein
MHPEIMRAMNKARIADLRASRASCYRPAPSGGSPLRTRSGWWLIEVGLRLVGPGLTPVGQ